MQAIGVLLGFVGILITFLAWLFPDKRHAVLSWLGFRRKLSQPGSTQIASKAEDLLDTGNPSAEGTAVPNAYDLINLGEHLWYLSNSLFEPSANIGKSISAFTLRLDKTGFPATRAAAKSIEHTTVADLQSQMTAVSSSLYAEATGRQAAFIKLGEFLWYLSNPKTATTQALEASINGFFEQLEKCHLETGRAASPLRRFRYTYLVNFNLVTAQSLDQLASIMKVIRHRLEHETRQLRVDD